MSAFEADGAAGPVGPAGTDQRTAYITVTSPDDTAVVGDAQGIPFFIPEEFNGFNLVRAHGALDTPGSGGSATLLQVRNVTQGVDMLTSGISIQVGDTGSWEGGSSPGTIDPANDDVATGDEIVIDVDVLSTNAQGIIAILTFEAP